MRRWLLVWAFFLLFCISGGHLYSPDCEINFRTTKAIAETGSYAIPSYAMGFGTRTGMDDKEYAQYGPLQPLLAVPFYVAGKVLGPLVPEAWLSAQSGRLYRTVSFYRPDVLDADSFDPVLVEGIYPKEHEGRVTRLFVSYFNPMATLLAAWVLLRISERLFGRRLITLSLPMVYLAGTMALPQAKPLYTESLAALCLLMSFYMAMGGRDEAACPRRRMVWCGFWFGLATLARLDSVVAAPGLSILVFEGFYSQRKSPRFILTSLFVAGGLTGALLAVHPALNYLRFGSVLASGYADQPEGINFGIPFLDALYIYLLSPGKGLFWYSPPLIAALLVWPRFFRRNRWIAAAAVSVALMYLLVVGRWQNLGGWCWGPRHLFQMTSFLLLPLPLLLEQDGSGNWNRSHLMAFVGCLTVGIFVQFWGVVVDYMWPLDQTLRGLAPGEDTAKVLSLPFYGPILHMWSWRLDPDPDMLLVDLWKSGVWSARIVGFVFYAGLAYASIQLLRPLRKFLRESVLSR